MRVNQLIKGMDTEEALQKLKSEGFQSIRKVGNTSILKINNLKNDKPVSQNQLVKEG